MLNLNSQELSYFLKSLIINSSIIISHSIKDTSIKEIIYNHLIDFKNKINLNDF